MRLDLLKAADGTALTKTFKEIAPGQYETSSYPHISKFNSVSVEVNTPEEFYDAIVAAANEGMAVLKGVLKKTLVNESRAGQTNSHTATNWLCLDIDATLPVDTDQLLEDLDPAFKNVSYIKQASASCGIKTRKEEWRGHLFVMLEEPVSPQVLKLWLAKCNLNVPYLAERLALSAGGFALRYPLDVSTCQNDKIIYIQPPECENFPDPFKENRFELVQKAHDKARLNVNPSATTIRRDTNRKVGQLRIESGLPARQARYATHASGVEVLKNPDPVVVTGKKEERGFVYLNLNGGDSFAYWFHPDSPDLLHNFKGEPAMYLRDVDTELWNEYAKPVIIDGEEVEVNRFHPFVCRSAVRDTYYNGIYREDNNSVELYVASSKGKLKDFLAQYGLPMEDHIVDWNIVFDPQSNKIFDADKHWVNTYRPSSYMKQAKIQDDTKIPPIIDRILNSLCGEEEVKSHFINWLACIFQFRIKLGTAWIFQGVQGTGKGLLYSAIMQPLMGHEQCYEITMDRFDDQFNNYLERNILLFIDEANVGDTRNGDRTLNKLKNLITEEEIMIRAMRSNPVSVRNYSNLIFASNQIDIVPIEESDRRFNVAPRQDTPLKISHEEVQAISGELQDFADYLYSYEANVQRARKVLLTEARENLIAAGQTTITAFFSAIQKGDLEYFTQFLRDDTPSDPSGLLYLTYRDVVLAWVEGAGAERPVTRDEMQKAYNYLQMVNQTMSPTKFSRMCAKYGLIIQSIRTDTGVTRGLPNHIWHISEDEKEALQNLPDTSKVSRMR